MDSITADDALIRAIRNGLQDAVTKKLTGYDSPLDKLIVDAVKANYSDLESLLKGCISVAVNDEPFREAVRSETRKKLAKLLVERFGGELEKQVNALKSDPATRARIRVAIDEIAATPAK